MTPRSCPACLESATSTLWTASPEQAAQAFIRRESDPTSFKALANHIEQLWGTREVELLHCDRCGLGFAHPFVGGDATFYNIAYPGTPGYPDNKWEFQLTIEDLAPRVKTRASDVRCLEVGAGIGNFLKRLSTLGIQSRNILALEFNEEALKVLRRRGFVGHAADIRTLDSTPFDLIFAFQVIEHLSELDTVFSRLASLLAPEGVIYIAMPNQARISFNESNGSLLDMPPQPHLALDQVCHPTYRRTARLGSP